MKHYIGKSILQTACVKATFLLLALLTLISGGIFGQEKDNRKLDYLSGTHQVVTLPPPQIRVLDKLVGKWINEGEVINDVPSARIKIVTSDVFEWAPGGFFLIHNAYGKAGNEDGGAVEIIGYDTKDQKYKTWCFDNRGILTQEVLTLEEDKWIFTGINTRFTGTISEDGKFFTGKHERFLQNKWVHVMDVRLTKIN